MKKSPFNDDELFTYIGRAVARWQNVEENAYLIFCLCPLPLPQAKILEIWNSQSAFHGRFKLLRKLLEHQQMPNNFRERWEGLVKQVQHQVKVRNRLAHCQLSTAPSVFEKPPIIAFEITERSRPFRRDGAKLTDKQLGQAGYDFMALSVAILDFALAIKTLSPAD